MKIFHCFENAIWSKKILNNLALFAQMSSSKKKCTYIGKLDDLHPKELKVWPGDQSCSFWPGSKLGQGPSGFKPQKHTC